MSYGVGRWRDIQECGLLPGKTIQQLSGQTQRLLGQQALVEFTGLRVDVDRVRADNDAKINDPDTGQPCLRKAGLLIHAGSNKRDRVSLQAAAFAKYGLTDAHAVKAQQQMERIAEKLDIQLREPPQTAHSSQQPCEAQKSDDKSSQDDPDASGACAPLQPPEGGVVPPVDSLIDVNAESLDEAARIALLHRLDVANAKLQRLIDRLRLERSQGPILGTTARPHLSELRSNWVTGMTSLPPPENGCCAALQTATNKSVLGRNAAKVHGIASNASRRAKPATRKGAREISRRRRGRTSYESDSEDDGSEMEDDSRAAEEAAFKHDVGALQAMGFDEKQAREALEHTDGNPDAAIEYLLRACAC